MTRAPPAVLHYEVLRRVDPLPAGAATPAKLDGWDFVAAVPAHGDNIYSVVVPTLADSTIAQGMHWSVFLVRAATATPLTFFDSPPDSGYSVDNLAPAPPSGLALEADCWRGTRQPRATSISSRCTARPVQLWARARSC